MTWTLEALDQRAVVAGTGAVTSYADGGVPVLAGAERTSRFSFRSSLLAPWPNRVVGASWTWEGQVLSLTVNEPETGAALHGLVYDAAWVAAQVSSVELVLTHVLEPTPGYPFSLALTASYALTAAGLACSLTARNTGDRRAPVGLGVHSYVDALGQVDDLELAVPAATLLQADARWQETGRVPVQETDLDFRTLARIGRRQIDAAFTDVCGNQARVRRPDGSEVTIWSGDTCRSWVVYTSHTLPEPDYRRSIAVEPMTCPPNAFNTGEIDVLEPEQELTLDWGFGHG